MKHYEKQEKNYMVLNTLTLMQYPITPRPSLTFSFRYCFKVPDVLLCIAYTLPVETFLFDLDRQDTIKMYYYTTKWVTITPVKVNVL